MGRPIFGADSRLDTDTVLSNIAAETGFPLDNLSDDREFTTFKPSTSATLEIRTDAGVGNTVDVDYFMAIGHDFNTQGASLVFASSPDDAVYTTIFSSTPGDDRVVVRTFTKVTRRFFRLTISGQSAAPSIGQLNWGVRVEPPFFALPSDFDPLMETARFRSGRSQSGNILGSVIGFVGRRANIRLELQPFTFVGGTTLGDFQEFWDNHAVAGKAFLWWWNQNDPTDPDPDPTFEKDAFWVVIDNDATISRRLRTQLDVGFRDIEFTVVGRKE